MFPCVSKNCGKWLLVESGVARTSSIVASKNRAMSSSVASLQSNSPSCTRATLTSHTLPPIGGCRLVFFCDCQVSDFPFYL